MPWKERTAHKRSRLEKAPLTSMTEDIAQENQVKPETKKRKKRKCVKQSQPAQVSESTATGVWKRKVHKLIRDGVASTSPTGCTLPDTPMEIGHLLYEGSKISNDAWKWGRYQLMQHGLKSGVLYKWKDKAKLEKAGDRTQRWRQHGDKGGRDRYAEMRDVRKWRKSLPPGASFPPQRLEKFLQDEVKERTGQKVEPCYNTIQLYFHECEQDPTMPGHITTHVYNKTEKRFIAEHSRRAVIMLIIVVLLTHAIPTKDPSLISTDSLEDKLVPYPHLWVNPMLCFNNDDTTFATAVLKGKQSVQVYLRPKNLFGHYSAFTMYTKKHRCFVSIKSHQSSVMGGALGPIVLSYKCKSRWWSDIGLIND